MARYKVTVFLGSVDGDDTDMDSFKDAIKDAMQAAIDADDAGDKDLDFISEEEEEDF